MRTLSIKCPICSTENLIITTTTNGGRTVNCSHCQTLFGAWGELIANQNKQNDRPAAVVD